MWINTLQKSSNHFLQLYNDFFNSLWTSDKNRLIAIKKYSGNANLMKVFVQCYYQDRVPSTVGNEVMRWSGTSYAKRENWKNILESYRNFRKWADENPQNMEKVVDINYRTVRDQVISNVDSMIWFQDAYSSREEYLQNTERKSAFIAWKQLHSAYGAGMLRHLRNTLPAILFHISTENGSYASQYIEQAEDKKKAKKESFGYAVDKLLDEKALAKQELRHKTNEVLWNMEELRHRIHVIVWYYSAWKKMYDAKMKEELASVLKEEKRDSAFKIGNVDGKNVDVVNGDYRDEEWNIHPYFDEGEKE